MDSQKTQKFKSEVLLVCQSYVLQTLVVIVVALFGITKRLGWGD